MPPFIEKESILTIRMTLHMCAICIVRLEMEYLTRISGNSKNMSSSETAANRSSTRESRHFQA